MAAESKKYISQDKLSTHNKPGDLWISIQGKIYNVSDWTNHHPGGELSASPAKTSRTRSSLTTPGRRGSTSTSSSPDSSSKAILFPKMGLFENRGHGVHFSLFLVAMLFTLRVCGVLCSDSCWVHLGSGGLMGFLWIQGGWLGHDSGHYQIISSKRVNRLAQILTGNCLAGISIAWWKRNHNAHHIAVNSLELDPDLQHMPFFAVNSKAFTSLTSYYYDRKMSFDAFTRFLVSYQHWTFYPVMCFARINLFAQSFLLLSSTRLRVNNRIQEILGFWIWYPLLVSYLPNRRERVMFVVASFSVTGVQHVQFCLNHFSSSVYVGTPTGNDWCETQTNGSLNIVCPSWMDWFHGGLQFQIEHHLFPRLPQGNLRKIAPLVKVLCEKHNLPYTSVSFYKANELTVWDTAHGSVAGSRSS